VTATVEWPRVSYTSLGWVPRENSKLAAVCRRSWKRVLWSRPAFSRSGLKERFIKLCRFTGVPVVERNTSSVLCHKGPNLERSSSYATR
jgi:hypothetical protein